jgi:hypothetical protein
MGAFFSEYAFSDPRVTKQFLTHEEFKSLLYYLSQEDFKTLAQKLKQESRHEEAIAIAKNLLNDGISTQATQKLTGLPEKEIMALVDKHQTFTNGGDSVRYSINPELYAKLKEAWDKSGLPREVQEVFLRAYELNIDCFA